MSRRFILCLGHQRCGTTWFHRYLCQHDNFDTGIAKEYHIWDALDVPIMSYKRRRFRDRFSEDRLRIRYFMQRKPETYFDYFASLYRDGVDLAADITPSYSGLGPERLAQIRQAFEARGVEMRVVILIRDPVARIQSAVRKNLKKKNNREGIARGETDFNAAIAQYITSPHCDLRTRYDRTIRTAQQVFAPGEVYVGTHETMFRPERIDALSAFCGVEPLHDFAGFTINKTSSAVDVSQDNIAAIRKRYADVYAYCSEHVLETREVWQPV